MRLLNLNCGLILALTASSVASPVNGNDHGASPRLQERQTPTNTSSPCASVSSAYYAATRMAVPTVPAQLAYECINSIPFNKSSALALIESIKPYIGWQTTTAYLKNPPAEYAERNWPSYDVWAELDKLKANVEAGNFKSEYQFGFALYRVSQQAHDGHFTYCPESVGSIFNWGRPVSLVSISEDGLKLPSVFVYHDILQASFTNSTYNPSPVISINGMDTVEFLKELSAYGSLQDRDALYNGLFYNLAQVGLGTQGTAGGMFSGGGRTRWFYPGPETILKFENGTTTKYQNFARVLKQFDGIDSGEKLADAYFYWSAGTAGAQQKIAEAKAQVKAAAMTRQSQPVSKRSRKAKRQSLQQPGYPLPGYPTPIIAQYSNIIGGYYLDGKDYQDVAILTIPTFVGGGADQQSDFQEVGDEFLKKAKADGKTKLIIDLSANGGGTILQAYDLFKKIFPQVEPYSANRWRYQDILYRIAEGTSDFAAPFPRDPLERNGTIRDAVVSPFNYRTDVDLNLKHFNSTAAKFGPHTANNDQFTTLHRWDLNDPLIPIPSGGIFITGYGPRKNVSTPYFKPEDIVLVTDGYCASTCGIFTEFMHTQVGVRTIAMGGLPNNKIIQAVGGVKGTNNYNWGLIQYEAQSLDFIYPQEKKDEAYNRTVLPYYNELPFLRSIGGSANANVRDGIALDDVEEVPLQFRIEDADCRIFYTAKMTTDVTAIWRAAADSAWERGDGSWCVAVRQDDVQPPAPPPTYYSSNRGMNKREVPDEFALTKRSGAKQVIAPDAKERFERLLESLKVATLPDHPAHVHGYMEP